jgi:ATP-binding protein involved in chromosome partitioning
MPSVEEPRPRAAESDHAPASDVSPDAVREALRDVQYPGLTRDLVALGMVDHVAACDGRVRVDLAIRTSDPSIPPRVEQRVRERLATLGARDVVVTIGEPRQAPPVSRGTPDPWADRVRLAAVRHVVAVGAGKGGVGKSTVAVNLALALARDGLRTGLLDADIYGPSLPILLGIEDGAARARMTPEKHIVPHVAHGLPMISFGFFLGEASPAVWRGPMVSKAVKQFARGVAWPELDVLVVDLPPGTGDVPLSLAQAVELSGAIVVTQPPRVAAAEALKAARMFESLDVPVLGVVENMSGAFGYGAGAAIASELDVAMLGDIPFDESIVRDGDAGVPTILARASSTAARRFDVVAERVAAALGWSRLEPAA